MSREMNPIQAIFDGMRVGWQRERSETQMTLGKMIETLENLPDDLLIMGFTEPQSYRGYYDDLSFEPQGERITVADALVMCRGAMGQVFEGYKGGDYMMGASTPVWIADYGCSGQRIMTIRPDGTVEMAWEED